MSENEQLASCFLKMHMHMNKYEQILDMNMHMNKYWKQPLLGFSQKYLFCLFNIHNNTN